MNSIEVLKTFKAWPRTIKEIEIEAKRIAVFTYGEKTLKSFVNCDLDSGPSWQFDVPAEGGWNRFLISYDLILTGTSIESVTFFILNPRKFIPNKG